MVFIHTRATDETTLEVIQWLLYYKKAFFRLNNAADLIAWNKDPAHCSCYFNGKANIIPDVHAGDKELNQQIREYLQGQADALLTHLLPDGTDCSFGLSPFRHKRLNKLEVLQLAAGIGFTIPQTAIVSTRATLKQLKQRWGRIITKSMHEGIAIHTEKVLIDGQRTEEITTEVIDAMAPSFFPSLVQQLVEKRFEIRVFFFRQRMHALALFTQNNKLSQIDGRAIDTMRPNRQVPYLLPDELKDKITTLMNKLDLNYGSLDFIYTPQDDYCFLEVNPYGQYGFLSEAGNYYIEKEIADYL